MSLSGTLHAPEPAALAAAGVRSLYGVYQPIVRLDDLALVAHEGLIRAEPDPVALHPLHLIEIARRLGRLGDFEMRAANVVVRDFASPDAQGKLLVNMSAQCLVHHPGAVASLIALCEGSGMASSRFVLELSERDVVTEVAALLQAASRLREAGIRIALDDFGNAHSNFEMWLELKPDYVKIDRYLVDGLRGSAARLVVVRSLVDVAHATGTDLIAEGIEHEDDVRLLRDLGIRYGQGFFFGRPARTPARQTEHPQRAAANATVPLRPSAPTPPSARKLRVEHLLIEADPVSPASTGGDVARRFERQPELHALPVVRDGVPLGLINRRAFMELFARPFVRELRARESCVALMSPAPVICEADLPIDAMVDVLRGEDQRYLADGFIIVRNGRYAGLGTGESLVRSVTEIRIEAARYANPLTLLPGNIPITEHIARLLDARRSFAAAYFDLNNFKPYNDAYGYFRGDEAIKLVARALGMHTADGVDFVGHVGGDDFVVLFQSSDWRERCDAILRASNAALVGLFNEEDRVDGTFESEDRGGRRTRFPLTSLAVGIAVIGTQERLLPVDVANFAAAAKREAKRQAGGVWIHSRD